MNISFQMAYPHTLFLADVASGRSHVPIRSLDTHNRPAPLAPRLRLHLELTLMGYLLGIIATASPDRTAPIGQKY
jgi:hypothetical protein